MYIIKVWFDRIIRSRVMWLSAIGAGMVALEASMGLLQPLLPVNVYAVIATVLSVGGAILRVLTTQALSDK